MKMLRLFLAALSLALGLAAAFPAHAQITRSATFTRGAVGEYSNNAHAPLNVKTFATMGFSSITISQTSANGVWGGTQGNDYAVNVVIAYTDGRPSVSFAASVNWVKNAGNSGTPGRFEWMGLDTLAAVADGYPLTPGRKQTYALQFASSVVTITDGMDIGGSANKGAAINALNENFPSWTNTNATDANGKPSYSFSYQENRPSGTLLGTVVLQDAGSQAPAFTYSITSGNTNGWFAINSATGAITLTATGATSLANNFEALANVHTLIVSAVSTTSSTTVQVVLNETDVVEAPEFTNTNATDGSGNPSYSFDYFENQATGATVGTVTAAGGTGARTFSITAGNTNAWYAINATTGVITLTAAGAASLANNFEAAPNVQMLTVRVTDGATPKTIQVALNELDVSEFDLGIAKSASYGPIPVNGLFDYTITATNLTAGAGNATSVVVTDQLPAGVTVRGITTSLGSCSQNGSLITCTLGTFANGATATIGIAATAPSTAGVITNTASISAAQTDVNSSNNSASVQSTIVVPTPLSVTKVSAIYAGSGAGAFAVPGQQIVYTIQVSNPSLSVTANTILIVDNLPAQMEFYNGDFDPAAVGSGPIKFTDGSTASGLTCCASADISYSNSATGTANPVFGYVPQAGFDPSVRFIRINPKGIMAAANGSSPSFTINFRGRVK